MVGFSGTSLVILSRSTCNNPVCIIYHLLIILRNFWNKNTTLLKAKRKFGCVSILLIHFFSFFFSFAWYKITSGSLQPLVIGKKEKRKKQKWVGVIKQYWFQHIFNRKKKPIWKFTKVKNLQYIRYIDTYGWIRKR